MRPKINIIVSNNKEVLKKTVRAGGKVCSKKVKVSKEIRQEEIEEEIIEPIEVPNVKDSNFVLKILENKRYNDFFEFTGISIEDNDFPSQEYIDGIVEESVSSNYSVVIDFESTCDTNNGIPKRDREIIEFAAIMYNTDIATVEDEFSMFVKPVFNPILSDYCTDLTSITQEDVDNAPSFSDVLAFFKEWLDEYKGEKTFCSWSTSDKMQLTNCCDRHDQDYPFDDNHIDIKKLFSNAKGYKRKYSLPSALNKMKMKFEGTQHRGIDDARNTARLYQELLKLEVE